MKSSLFRTKSFEHLEGDSSLPSLKRHLKVKDLTAMGIAAIIGAGIFGTVGNAAFNGGPAISLVFIFTALACACSALCYAEFASRIPISGSAYTYAYFAFGEIIAWIIGWDLILEYAIGNIVVAISWSDYITSFMSSLNINFPEWLSIDYLSALKANQNPETFNPAMVKEATLAWSNAPSIFGIKMIMDIPALVIVVLVTYLVYIGIKETKNLNNIMVVMKLAIILLVIIVGALYINPTNWKPFAPNGISGMLKGIAAIFFAYVGFDAISTTAEETQNPQKSLPKAIIYSLIICTILYVAISFVLTGAVSYKKLAVGDPMAYIFEKLNLPFMQGLVAGGAIIAMAGVLIVFQLGQPRILFSMGRDGLLPKKFKTIHSKYKTPSFATIITGFIVAIPALFMNITELTDLTVIGTLFAFIVVSAGVMLNKVQPQVNIEHKHFKVPYLNGKYYLPIIYLILTVIVYLFYAEEFLKLFYNSTQLMDNVPIILFMIGALVLLFITIKKNLSLIPALGVLSCSFLMAQLGASNWIRFLIWMLIGLVIYFIFGRRNSILSQSRS